MCGICGTYILNFIDESNLIDSNKLIEKISKIHNVNSSTKLKNIYKIIQKYKSDINFLNYFHNSSERKNIKIIISLLKKIKKQKKTNNISITDDCLFSLEVELSNRYKFVKNNLDQQYKLNDKYIIFLKVLNSLINSINYLEMRGRDSLGVCIQVKILKEDILNIKYLNNKKIKLVEQKDYFIFTFVYKTYNSIGILRQNSYEILNDLFSDKTLIRILNLNYDKVSILFHTRWASVGKINHSNTHPIQDFLKNNNEDLVSYTATNGDIYNYKKIIDYYKHKLENINHDCETDSLALSLVIGKILKSNNKNSIKTLLEKIKGSYCSCTISDTLPGSIFLVKSGQQGLYVGNSVDRYYFSSDVYGLVEESYNFFKIEDDCYINLPNNPKSELLITIYNNNKQKIINQKKFKEIGLNLNDIYLGNKPHYYFKEFLESESIIRKTNAQYLSTKNLENINMSKFKELKNFILKNKIRKIIITGMGTCYTAAVAISQYMREIVTNHTNLNLVIQPHIASEGSGFYTNKDMNDHLIIVLGQSGTTIDTNTYAKIGKQEGAYTVSFLNKRQGDLSYLVDLNLYVGNGRDVEISVPSTKTYLAHVVIGYIFTLMLIKNKYNQKLINKEKNKLLNIPKIIKKQINNVQKYNFDKLTDIFCKNPNWYIVYDDSKLSVTNNEIKIKLSELCYQSIPTFNIKYSIILKIKNSIIIFNSAEKYINLRNYINILLERNNTILIVSSDLKFNLIKHNNLFFYNQIYNERNFEIFNSIIFFQYFAYCLAIKLNKRFEILNNYLNNTDKRNFTSSVKYLKSYIESGFFNHGGLKDYINDNFTNKEIFLKIKNNKDTVRNKILFLMRPIDTVKHQAKTITVGATRNTTSKVRKNIKYYPLNKNKKLKENYFLFSNFLHESYVYDLVNLLNKSIKNNKFEYHLARSYDLDKISIKKLNFIDLDSIIKTNNNKSFLSLTEYANLKSKLMNKLNLFSGISLYKPNYKLISNNSFNIINKNINNHQNIKILGSGVNYNSAKLISLFLTKLFKKPISYEVLENHKHIDVSAEPLLIILLGNIDNNIYHSDAISEIIKFHSHNNKCILFLDKKNMKYYKKLPIDIIKFEHKSVLETQSFSFYLGLIFKLFKINIVI
jgi:glucosamine 6-phosphate synthetase-like amidotransferase/phosphosugar isomerase protein